MLQSQAHGNPGASGWIKQNLTYIFLTSLFRLLLPLLTKGPLSPKCFLKILHTVKAWIKWTVIQKYSSGHPIWKNYLVHYIFLALSLCYRHSHIHSHSPRVGGRGKVPKGESPKMIPDYTLWCFCSERITSLRYKEKRREPKMTWRAVLTSEIANILKREDNMSNSSGTHGLKEVAMGLKSSKSFHSNEGNSDPFNSYTILYFTVKSMSSHLSCCP